MQKRLIRLDYSEADVRHRRQWVPIRPDATGSFPAANTDSGLSLGALADVSAAIGTIAKSCHRPVLATLRAVAELLRGSILG
jgi:hypothetical protein